MAYQDPRSRTHTVETGKSPVLAWETVQTLSRKVYENLNPFRINDRVGYSLQNRGNISATFARHGFSFNEIPFQVPGVKHAEPEAVAFEVTRQIVPSAVEMRQGKKFTLARVCIEKPSGDCVIAFGRAIDPERALDKVAGDIVRKMGGSHKMLDLVIIPHPKQTKAAAFPTY